MFNLNLNTLQQPASNPFSATTTSSQPQPSIFGHSQQQSGGLFGVSSQPQQQGSGLFSGSGLNTQHQGAGLFGGSGQSTQQPGGGLLAGPSQTTQQQSSGGLFGTGGQSIQQQPHLNKSLLGGLGQSTQQQSQQPPQFSQNQQDTPLLQLGKSNQENPFAQVQAQVSLWEAGRGIGVYRTIPAQMAIVKEKWDPSSLASPLRTYLYQVEDEQNVPFYQPGQGEDEQKWEEAISKRPGPNYVPVLARGFWDLGKRAQRQREFIEKCNIRLHDINSSLDAQLEIHSQRIGNQIVECRRRHAVASQRTLALAAKIQVLKNRGYVMDNAEEELRAKLAKMEREVLDPTLSGREQEVWARMLGIRERSKRLKVELEKTTPTVTQEDATLDEETIKVAKKALEAYDIQLRHLHNELQLVQQEYADWEKSLADIENDESAPRR